MEAVMPPETARAPSIPPAPQQQTWSHGIRSEYRIWIRGCVGGSGGHIRVTLAEGVPAGAGARSALHRSVPDSA
eukprot:804104-Rhodomonas_salina.4